MESLLAVLKILHSSSFSDENADFSNQICKPFCLAHNFFNLNIEETIVCECGESQTYSWDFSAFVHTFYMAQIFEDAKGEPEKLANVPDEELEEFIEYSSVASCENRLCDYIKTQLLFPLDMCPGPQKCQWSRSSKILELKSSPKIFIISLIWENVYPLLINLLQAYSAIPSSINISNIYTTRLSQFYTLTSMILYGCGHYISMIRKAGHWFKVDDEKVLHLGDWKDLVDFVCKSRFYPVGLFYSQSVLYENNEITLKTWIQLEKKIIIDSEFREIIKTHSSTKLVENFNQKLKNSVNFSQKPQISSKLCRFCNRKISTEYFLCFECYTLGTTETCQFCKIKATKDYCKVCVKSNLRCECGLRYHIMDLQCECKLNNHYYIR